MIIATITTTQRHRHPHRMTYAAQHRRCEISLAALTYTATPAGCDVRYQGQWVATIPTLSALRHWLETVTDETLRRIIHFGHKGQARKDNACALSCA